MRWRVRDFEKRDLARLCALDRVCFPPGIAYSRAELQYYLTQPGCSSWVVEESELAGSEPGGRQLNGQSIGGFLILERIHLEQQSAGHVVTIDVDPIARRQGLGALLMRTAEAQLKQEGALRIRLEVAADNLIAQRFYSSLSFVYRGRIPKYYGGRIDANVMDKTL